MTEGILWAGSSIKHPETLAEEAFNKWYNETHLSDVLHTGAADFAIRYKNLDKSRPYQFLAIYRLPDNNAFTLATFQSLNVKSPLLGTDKDANHELTMDLRIMELVQHVEGVGSDKLETRGLVTTCVDVPESLDQDFNDWFNHQHIPMVSLVRGFVRVTRYEINKEHPLNAQNPRGNAPQYATLYEYSTTDFPTDQLAVVATTEWSKKIIPQLTRIERDTWVYITDTASGNKLSPRGRLGRL